MATLIEHFLGLILIDLPVCLQRISLIFFHIFREDLKVQVSDDDDDHLRSPVMPNENEQTLWRRMSTRAHERETEKRFSVLVPKKGENAVPALSERKESEQKEQSFLLSANVNRSKD